MIKKARIVKNKGGFNSSIQSKKAVIAHWALVKENARQILSASGFQGQVQRGPKAPRRERVFPTGRSAALKNAGRNPANAGNYKWNQTFTTGGIVGRQLVPKKVVVPGGQKEFNNLNQAESKLGLWYAAPSDNPHYTVGSSRIPSKLIFSKLESLGPGQSSSFEYNGIPVKCERLSNGSFVVSTPDHEIVENREIIHYEKIPEWKFARQKRSAHARAFRHGSGPAKKGTMAEKRSQRLNVKRTKRITSGTGARPGREARKKPKAEPKV